MIKKTVPATLYDISLTFRDTDEKFESTGDLLNMITNKNYKDDLADSLDKKLMFDIAKETNSSQYNKQYLQGCNKTMMVTSEESSKAIGDEKEKVLNLLNDKGIIASFLVIPLPSLLKPENKNHFELVKDPFQIR